MVPNLVVLFPVVLWTGLLFLANAAALYGLKTVWPATFRQDRNKLVQTAYFASTFFYFVPVTVFSHRGVAEVLFPDAQARNEVQMRSVMGFFAGSANCERFIQMELAFQFFTWGHEIYFGQFNWQLGLHHLATIPCLACVVCTGRFQFWATAAGLCVNNSLFIYPIRLAQDFPSLKSHAWFRVNGVAAWLSYFVYRIVWWPCWLALWFLRGPGNGAWLPSRDGVGDSVGDGFASRLALVMAPAGIVILWGLSCMWFSQLHNGLKKMLRAVGSIPDKTDDGGKEKTS